MLKIHIGLDLSSTVCGFAVIDDNEKILHLTAINISKLKHPKEKCNKIFEELDKWKSHEILSITVEEPVLGFTQGKTSNHTITMLIRWNGIFCYVLEDLYKISPILADVNTARKTIFGKCREKGKTGKEYTKIRLYERFDLTPWTITNKKGNEDKKMEDIRDGLVCALYGKSQTK